RAGRGLPRLLDLEDPSEEYPPTYPAEVLILEFYDLASPDSLLKNLEGPLCACPVGVEVPPKGVLTGPGPTYGANDRANFRRCSSALILRRSRSYSFLQDISIVEAKLSSRGNMPVASMYQTSFYVPKLSSRGSVQCCSLPPEETSHSLPPGEASYSLPPEETSYSLPPEGTSYFLPPEETGYSLPPEGASHSLPPEETGYFLPP
ncbi:hypothetical protein Tco_1241087, partial [Tanacetum coccineum]